MLGNAPELKGPGVGWCEETFGSWSLSCGPCMLAVASWSVLEVLASESQSLHHTQDQLNDVFIFPEASGNENDSHLKGDKR